MECFREDQALIEAADLVLLAPRWMSETNRLRIDSLPDALLSQGKRIAIVGNTAEFSLEAPNIVKGIWRWHSADGFPIAAANKAHFARLTPETVPFNDDLKAHAAKRDIPYLDRYGLLCDLSAQSCTGVTPDGRATLFDKTHWTLAGAAYLGQKIATRDWLSGLIP